MNKAQKGFALIESLLILTIILLVGFIGYYVWHTSSKTKQTYQNSANVSSKQANPNANVKANTAYLQYPYSSIQKITYAAAPAGLQMAILKDYSPAPTCIKNGLPLGAGDDPNGPEIFYVTDKFAVANIGCGIDGPNYLYVAQSSNWKSMQFNDSGAFLACATLNKYNVPTTLIDKFSNLPDGSYVCNPRDGDLEPESYIKDTSTP